MRKILISRATQLVALVLCVTTAARARTQSAPEVEKGAHAVVVALKSTDDVISQLKSLQSQVGETLRVLRETKGDVARGGMKEAAADIGALTQTMQKLEAQIAEHMEAITRIRKEGAGEEGDPLGQLQARIATVLQNPDLGQQEEGLLRLQVEVQKAPAMQPFIGLVHYRTGEVLRERAVRLLGNPTRSETLEAEKLLNRATRSYEAAASEGVNDVRGTAVGSSSKASALCRLVQVKGQLYLGYARLAGESGGDFARQKAKELRDYANEKFRILSHAYADELLDNQQRAVDAARADIDRIRGQSNR